PEGLPSAFATTPPLAKYPGVGPGVPARPPEATELIQRTQSAPRSRTASGTSTPSPGESTAGISSTPGLYPGRTPPLASLIGSGGSGMSPPTPGMLAAFFQSDRIPSFQTKSITAWIAPLTMDFRPSQIPTTLSPIHSKNSPTDSTPRLIPLNAGRITFSHAQRIAPPTASQTGLITLS